jgi:hypothetical protein
MAKAKKETPVAADPAAAAAAAAPAAKAKKEKVVKEAKLKIEQNGVSRPSPGTTTGRIWEIADEISAKLKAPAPRKDVMEQTKALGINDATAATQYGKWRKFNGLKSEPKAAKPAPAAK